MKISICLTTKDEKIRRYFALVRENNQSVSAYVTLAIRAYLYQKHPICLGNVRQAKYVESEMSSFYLPEDVVSDLDVLCRQLGNRKRSQIIKAVLNKSIEQSGYKTEEVSDLYELMDQVLMMEPVVRKVEETVKEEPVKEAAKVMKVSAKAVDEPVSKPAKKEIKTMAAENKLLGGLFPDLLSQTDDWD